MKALMAMACFLFGTAAANAGADLAPIEAIWMPQVVNFVYRTGDTAYTCSGLWQKLAGMLVYVGARPAAPSDRLKCDDAAGTVTLQFALESPVEATPENLRALTDFDTQDLLVARLQGKELPTEQDVTRFPAAWRTLSFRDSRLQLTAGDCELVRQMRRQILPKLSVEIVNEPPVCSSLLVHGGRPSMTVRALLVAG
jgi:hypothetical protein